MKLAIVGSTNLTDTQVNDIVWLLEHIIIGPLTVISGGAIGVDTLAITVAKFYRKETQEILPDVDKWDPPGQRGYKARNIEIAQECDELVAIRSLQSKTYGSGWTADYAEKIGRKVRRFYV